MERHPNTAFPESHPCYHTAAVKAMLTDIIEPMREDRGKFQEPKAQALFETSADVLMGLYTAFDHYEQSENKAMREPDRRDRQGNLNEQVK